MPRRRVEEDRAFDNSFDFLLANGDLLLAEGLGACGSSSCTTMVGKFGSFAAPPAAVERLRSGSDARLFVEREGAMPESRLAVSCESAVGVRGLGDVFGEVRGRCVRFTFSLSEVVVEFGED